MSWHEADPAMPAREKALLRKNWIRWAFLVGACLFYAWFYTGFLPYTVLYAVLLLPVVSFLCLMVNLFTFRIGESLNERTFVKGDRAKYRLVLGNESPVPIPYVTITMYLEGRILCSEMKSMHMSLAPFAKREYVYELPLPYRGRYEVGVRDIVFRDFLGMFFLRHRPLERKSILVRPRVRILSHKTIPAAMVSEGNVLAGLFEAGNDEMIDIRRYAPGASLRKMHWKLSAKSGNLMVRDMRNELDNDILFLLDVSAPPEQNAETLAREDCLIEEAIAQAQYLLSRGMPARICFWREEPVVLRAATPGDFMKAYELLSEVKFNQEGRFEDVVDNFLETGAHRSLAYLFTVQLTHGIIEKCIVLRHRGYDVELYYLLAPDAAGPDTKANMRGIADQLAQNGIRVFRLVPEPIDSEEGGRAS